MLRHRLNHVTIVPSMLVQEPGGTLHMSMTREYAEDDAKEASGEVVYTRDTVDVQVSDPAIVAQARDLARAIAQHYADNARVPVKLNPARGPLVEPAPSEPRPA